MFYIRSKLVVHGAGWRGKNREMNPTKWRNQSAVGAHWEWEHKIVWAKSPGICHHSSFGEVMPNSLFLVRLRVLKKRPPLSLWNKHLNYCLCEQSRQLHLSRIYTSTESLGWKTSGEQEQPGFDPPQHQKLGSANDTSSDWLTFRKEELEWGCGQLAHFRSRRLSLIGWSSEVSLFKLLVTDQLNSFKASSYSYFCLAHRTARLCWRVQELLFSRAN